MNTCAFYFNVNNSGFENTPYNLKIPYVIFFSNSFGLNFYGSVSEDNFVSQEENLETVPNGLIVS